jgi:LmbE family N-acetylglucosaminyl deacetylase
MTSPSLRRTIAQRYRSQLEALPSAPIAPAARTLVFAPHPDDETLGCGGTIALKRKAGIPVRIAVLTDGSRSHPRLMARDSMRAIRERETLAAAAILGVEQQNVEFLRFPDTELARHHEAAVEQVSGILERDAPDEVYLPYRHDPLGDHVAAAAIVLEALRSCRRAVRLYEYPIWLWLTWPWVPVGTGLRRWQRSLWKSTLRAQFGRRLAREFTCVVDIETVADVKRAALDCHESQITRYLPMPGWTTLGGIFEGAFLENLLQPREPFRLSVAPAQRG